MRLIEWLGRYCPPDQAQQTGKTMNKKKDNRKTKLLNCVRHTHIFIRKQPQHTLFEVSLRQRFRVVFTIHYYPHHYAPLFLAMIAVQWFTFSKRTCHIYLWRLLRRETLCFKRRLTGLGELTMIELDLNPVRIIPKIPRPGSRPYP